MRRGVFGVRIDLDDEPILKQKCNKISEIKKTIRQLEAKFK